MIDLAGKYLAGEATTEEQRLVQEWRALSADNQKYFEHLKLIFTKASLYRHADDFNTDAAWRKVKMKMDQEKTHVWFFRPEILKIAASLLLVSVIGIWLYTQVLSPNDNLEFVSANEVVKNALPDGSQVILNKHTALTVTYNPRKNKARIKLKGEASFEVKHDAKKELIVETENVFIRDIGTVFNVKAYPESNLIEVTVQEGEVQFFTESDNGIFIRAGGKGVYDKLKRKFVAEQADTNVLSYKTRNFIFENNDLASVVEHLNAIYEKKIRIADNLKTCRVTVSFHNEDIETIADILAETLSLTIKNTENEIILEGNGCD